MTTEWHQMTQQQTDAELFKRFYPMPEGHLFEVAPTAKDALQLFQDLQTKASLSNMKTHRVMFVRSSALLIQHFDWTEEQSKQLLALADWFCEFNTKASGSYNFSSRMKQLTDVISAKIKVPPEKQEKWNMLFTRQKPLITQKKFPQQEADAYFAPFATGTVTHKRHTVLKDVKSRRHERD